jgi:glycerol-3-phosphate acyltransferase PlsX
LLGALGAWLSRPAFRLLKDRLDPAFYGGAPLLGVNGTCIVGHGASSPRAIRNAIGVAQRIVELKVNQQIRDRIQLLRITRTGRGTESGSLRAAHA